MTTSAGGVVKAQPWNDPSARPYVEVERISKSFGEFTAVNDVSLKTMGEIFCRALPAVRRRAAHAGRIRNAHRQENPHDGGTR